MGCVRTASPGHSGTPAKKQSNNMRIFRLKSALLAVGMMLTTAAASAVTFTVKVGNPDAVRCTVSGSPKELTSGDNLFDVAEYSRVSFTGVEPYYITNVTNQAGTAANGYYQGSWNFYPSSYDDGSVFTIATINLNDVRTSTFTINVDDPSLVRAQLSGYSRVLALTAGANTIKFDDVTENTLFLSSTDYYKPLYEVKLNGETVASQNGGYNILISNGCTVDITAVIPDIDINVTFSYADEESKGAIQSVAIDGVTVENFNGAPLSMKAGQTLSLNDNRDYKIESVKLNGSPITWTGGYSYNSILLEDTEINVKAHPYGTVTATIDIDDPSNIILYRGYSYMEDVIELVPGINEVELSENNAVISWEAADGCYITSVTVGDETLSEYQTDFTLTADTTLKFITGKIVMDKKAVVWVNDLAKANYYFSFQGYDRSNIALENGYNEVPFYEKMTPFMVGWAGLDLNYNQVYINNELVNPQYEGSSNWELPIQDGDVAKFYIGAEAVSCDVMFEAGDAIEATVVYDRVKVVEDWRAGFSCLNGTEVSVAGTGLKLTVNGVSLEANEDQNFVFTVTEPATSVKITNEEATGVSDIAVDNISEDAPVYNLNGARVATRATAGTLPAGIYVMNGRKMVVRK